MGDDSSASWKARHGEWLGYVRNAARLLEAGKSIALGPAAAPLVAPPAPAAERPLRVAICSPHPDDEALIGALPVRLRLECGARVTNCAVTFGSNLSQRPRRLRELESACRVLGFELVIPREPLGFDNVSLQTRTERPGEWAEKVELLSRCFERLQPDVVLAPHAEDWNKGHIGTHYLAVDALGDYLVRAGIASLSLVETEFWHENSQPNLMVGVSPEVEAILVMATAEHGGEVSRNPYHLRHPSRMIENVRLGAETVGGQGGAAPDFPFAELYRVTFMKGKEQIPAKAGGQILGPDDKLDWAAVLDQFRPAGL
jgi:LmbE family N-acetylglucosaminyl deacetylase